jgi:hypothetical protein
MKNGNDKLYTVKKNISFSNEVILMEGDTLKYVGSDRDNKDQVYHNFEVVNSAWSEEIEFSWTPAEVAEYLRYKTIYI